MKKADALSFEQALELMPNEFHPYAILNSRSKQVESGIEKYIISFHQSSKLKNGGWKTSHKEEELFEEVDFILFALGYEGILLLPSEVILGFNEDNYQSRYSGNRIPIHIFKDNMDGRTEYFWQGRDNNRLYVTEYFYPYQKKIPEKYEEIFHLWDKNAEKDLSSGMELLYQKEEDKANII